MSKKLAAVLGLLSVLLGPSAHGQYSSVEQDEAAKQAAKEQAVDTERQKYVGRRFWITPNPKATSHIKFVDTLGQYGYQNTEFVVTEPTSFVVSGFTRQRNDNYAQVTFQDGKVAYLKENVSFEYDPKEASLFEHMYSLTEYTFDFVEYIFPMSPADLKVALEKKRSKAAAAAAALKARGGVRLGMTADQVRKSSWGKPSSINRSVGSYGVHEQWVYGGNNYIYLENGRVTSIQN